MIDFRILWSADCAEDSLTGLGFRGPRIVQNILSLSKKRNGTYFWGIYFWSPKTCEEPTILVLGSFVLLYVNSMTISTLKVFDKLGTPRACEYRRFGS